MAEEVVARLLGGRELRGLGLDKHDGRVDLRCLPAPEPQRLRRFETRGWFVEELGGLLTFRGVELVGLDLSEALLQSLRFHDTSLMDCRFERTLCRDWRMWGCRVTDCGFAGADLRGAAVGTWHDNRRNEWRRIDFSRADFRVGVSWGALYEDCGFAAAKLTSVEFGQCTLVRCRFAGPLRGVLFDGRPVPDRPFGGRLEDVDFTDALFDEVEFKGMHLDRTVLPADPDVRLIRHYRCVVERALTLLEGDESLAARRMRAEFNNSLHMMRTPDEDNIFNVRDYRDRGGDELAARALAVYTQAQAHCGETVTAP